MIRTSVQIRSFRLAPALVAAACLLPLAATSSARASSETDRLASVAVNYSDLNLATQEGASALYRRIVAAARVVCPNPDIRDLGAVAATRACREQAVAHAVETVRNPLLAAVYAAAHTRHG